MIRALIASLLFVTPAMAQYNDLGRAVDDAFNGVGGSPAVSRPAAPAPAQNVRYPRFSEFPIQSGLYKGKRVPPKLDNEDKRMFRTRIREAAATEPVNFAGRYVLTTWGCGTSCLQGAIINVANGEVFMLPFSVQGSLKLDEEGAERVDTREDSALIIFAGYLNEESPPGYHYYVFDGKQLILKAKRATPEDTYR